MCWVNSRRKVKVVVMLYTITIEIDCQNNEDAKSIMECAKDEVIAVLDPDKDEDIISWRVDPK